MTSLDTQTLPADSREPRTELDVYRDQLDGIAAWHAAFRAGAARQRAMETAGRSRELRLEVARRLDVVRRQHQALVQRTEEHMRATGQLLRTTHTARAIVAHRNDWFKDKIITGLAAGGVEVVARLDNGADAVGIAVAEQADLILVEDRLPLTTGEEIVRQVRQFAPHTVVAVQAQNDWEIGALLEAGAQAAFTRRVPPAEVAGELCLLLTT